MVTNRWPWPLWGLSLARGFETLDDRGDLQSTGVSLARIPGWSTSEFPWEFTPPGRGVYPLAAPQLETGFPFGLYQAKCEVECTEELIVWPQAYGVDCIPETPDQNASEEHLSDRRVGDFGDVMGTREFRDGDSLRRVHWAQTARLGRLIVCERQAPKNQVVTVILDAGLDDTLEDRIRIVAGIAESLKRMHTTAEVCPSIRSVQRHTRMALFNRCRPRFFTGCVRRCPGR